MLSVKDEGGKTVGVPTLKCSRTAATDSEDHCNVHSRLVPAYHKNANEP